jgi:2-hydroxychromene-2-carboxylate isomerase
MTSSTTNEGARAAARAAPIEFYFDLLSPYGYLGSVQIDAVGARTGRPVDWRPVLIGVLVMKLMGLKPLMQTPVKGPYLYQDAPRVAAMLGVPFKHHGLTGINSLAAMRAFVWIKARDPALAVAFAGRIYQRLWVESRDITSGTEMAAEAAAFGLDAGEVLDAINGAAAKQALQVEVDAAIAKGVFGVPFFIADGQSFWGGDRIPMLEHWLTHHSWEAIRP